MATDSRIADQILGALAEHLKRDKQSIRQENTLRDDLGLDSIATIELLFKLEDVFNLRIPDEDLQDLTTVRDVIHYVEKRVTPAPALKPSGQAAKTKRSKR
jgi:acyl carrier protein